MPFDPSKPADHVEITSAELRSQFTGLDAKIPSSAVVDATNTNGAGTNASATVTFSGGVLHFTFGIPAGSQGGPGPQGDPGEVTQAQLSNDLGNAINQALNTILPLTSANTNNVATMNENHADLVVQALIDKVNELILAARR